MAAIEKIQLKRNFAWASTIDSAIEWINARNAYDVSSGLEQFLDDGEPMICSYLNTGQTTTVEHALLVGKLADASTGRVEAIKISTGESGGGSTTELKVVVVTQLPAEGAAETGTVYCLTRTGTDIPEDNKYEEYILVNNAWEKFGGSPTSYEWNAI